MKNILKLILIATILLAIHGCATHAKFIKKYDAWIGQNISQLITQIGYPDSTFKLPNKNKVYVYERSRIYSLPSPVLGYGYGGLYGSYNLFGYGNDVIQETCKLFIETNKKGLVIKWGSRGNHCVSN
ncbi:MAG TPA: hypothetical protein EYG82_00670 [Sulfurovum sp.]|nr:hypothetical protein [Sulfurovum sp.]